MPVKRSSIAWCDYSGADLNFVIGCTPASEGCQSCYARRIIADRGGRDFAQVQTYSEKLARLRTTRFVAGDVPFRRGPDSRPLLFPVDLGDLFHPAVPDTLIESAMNVMAERADADWLVLTKRPGRMTTIADVLGWPHNVWAGVTVENQRRAYERLPLLLSIPARVRFLSVEPLLGPLNLLPYIGAWCGVCGWRQTELAQVDRTRATLMHSNNSCPRCGSAVSLSHRGIHWLIVGGESGPHRRQFDVAWARSLRDQCQQAGVSFFYKQGSALQPGQDNLLDGQICHEFPR